MPQAAGLLGVSFARRDRRHGHDDERLAHSPPPVHAPEQHLARHVGAELPPHRGYYLGRPVLPAGQERPRRTLVVSPAALQLIESARQLDLPGRRVPVPSTNASSKSIMGGATG